MSISTTAALHSRTRTGDLFSFLSFGLAQTTTSALGLLCTMHHSAFLVHLRQRIAVVIV